MQESAQRSKRTCSARRLGVGWLLPALLLTAVLAMPAAADFEGTCPEGETPPAGFVDVATDSVHAQAIDCIAWHEITLGVSEDRFAPGQDIRRDQMASFIGRVIEATGTDLGSPEDQGFTDVSSENPHADAINQLAAHEIALGTSPTTFAPGEVVRRDQMASFLVRVVEFVLQAPMAEGETQLEDIAGNAHETNIIKIVTAELARGTTTTTYSPLDSVRREQMASFLARVLAALGVEPPDHELPEVTWVAVGVSGQVSVSDTGASWSPVAYPFSGEVHDVAHDGIGRWVAVGDFGQVATSTDGGNWTAVDYPHSGHVRGVAHDGVGRWVAVGDFGQVATSIDAVTWTTIDYPHTGTVNTVGHDGEGRWIAAGTDAEAATSTDGQTWSGIDVGFQGQAVHAVASDGLGGWIAVGVNPHDNVSGSRDGLEWWPAGLVRISVSWDVAHDGEGRWVTVGQPGERSSVATTTGPPASVVWDNPEYPHDRVVRGVAHDGANRWIAVGSGGQVARSSDGQIWSAAPYPFTDRINSVAANRGPR